METSYFIDIDLCWVVIRFDFEYFSKSDSELVVHWDVKTYNPDIKYPDCYTSPGGEISWEIGLICDWEIVDLDNN